MFAHFLNEASVTSPVMCGGREGWERRRLPDDATHPVRMVVGGGAAHVDVGMKAGVRAAAKAPGATTCGLQPHCRVGPASSRGEKEKHLHIVTQPQLISLLDVFCEITCDWIVC